MNDNDNLTHSQRLLVSKAIQNCRWLGCHTTATEGDGEAYAYPHPRGGISWGFNDGKTGFCIARGVVESGN